MKRTKKSVSALIVALCMLVQLIPAFPVQTASAAGETESEAIVLDFYNANGYTIVDTTLVTNNQTYGKDVNGDNVYFMYLPLGVGEIGAVNEKKFIVEFYVDESGYYEYDPTIWVANLRPSDIDFIVETPKYENSPDMVSLLCQNTKMKYETVKNNGGNGVSQEKHHFQWYTTDESQIRECVGNDSGDILKDTFDVTKPEKNMPYFGGYVYLTKGTNRFIVKRNLNSGYCGLNKVVFTKVDNTAGNFAIDFTKKANGTSTAYKDATLAYNGWRLNSDMYDAEGALITTGVFKSTETILRNGDAYMNFSTWNEVLALDILVPADDTYDVTLTAEDNINANGGTMLFSIDGKKLSAVNAAAECGEILLGGLQLTEGIHELEIELVGSTGVNSRKYLGMKELSFESVNQATTVTEAVITSPMVVTAADADVEKHGWAINEVETTPYLYDKFAVDINEANDTSDALRYSGIYVPFNNTDEDFGDTLAIDVNVPEEGTYNVSALFNEVNDFGGVFDLYVGDECLGRVYNDPNGVYVDSSGKETNKFTFKGFGNVELKEGSNTFKFVRNADDLIGAGSRAYFGLQSITLTPATGSEAQGITLTAPDTINVGETANVTAVMNYADGASNSEGVIVTLRPAYYSIPNPEYTEDPNVSQFIAANNNDSSVTAATLLADDGKLTGNQAGRFVIEARATIDGKLLYTAQKHVYVNAAPEMTGEADDGAPFGEIYAYVQEYKDDTYKVTFIGGVNETNGFEEIGYEIKVGDNTVDYGSGYVYEKITVNGAPYTAKEDFGSDYIFIGARDGIKAGETVTARPYVMVPDEDDDGKPEKEYFGDVVLTLSFEY